MAVRFVSLTPIEHEYYEKDPDLRAVVDSVGEMIVDLHDESIDVDIVLAMNDVDNPKEFTLAFSGSTLALEFYPNEIYVSDFDHAEDESGEILAIFERDEIKQATTWLINRLEQ